MPAPAPTLRRELVLWMVVLRRLTLLAGIAVAVVQQMVQPGSVPWSVGLVLAGVCLYNEGGRSLVLRWGAERLTAIVNVGAVLDTLALVVLLHFWGGLASPAVLFFAPAFFAYGAVLALSHTLAHVLVATVELAILGFAEQAGMLVHHASPFGLSGSYTDVKFVAVVIACVSFVSALSAYLSHYLAGLLGKHETDSRSLASERGALLESNEREAARVRALLEVAHLVSGTHTIEALLRAVCDTTVALVRVPRVEIFLWDRERQCLHLAAARGLGDTLLSESEGELQYPAELPIVARLRAGEVVDFGAGSVPARALAVPFRRGFAAPMVYRGSFEGALFVGYDGDSQDDLMELVQGIARQAALALANVRTMEQQQEDAEVNRVLLEISQGLSACLDEEALWTLLARGACDTLGLPWAVASRFDERAGAFTVAGTQGVPAAVTKRIDGARFRLEDHPIMQETLSRRALVVVDRGDARPSTLPSDWEVGSWLAMPLFRGSWVAGVLIVGAASGRKPFGRRQLRLAEGLRHHASIALQNARLVGDLEAADQLKSEFVSTMSHELRTPLNVIIGYTEMLREGAVGPVTAAQLELINRLDARGRELLELIEATLHVGRLEAGRDTVEISPIDLPTLVDVLRTATAGLPRPSGVVFDWEVPRAAAQVRIMTDRAKVALVIRNLVSNAFKFTSAGKVIVRTSVRGEALVLEVRDTGIGISAEHLPIIFEMFRQVDGSMTRRHGGVGLGLYIVKQFVTRLGGTVDVTSTPGRGSVFRVVLPSVIAGERQASSAAA